MYLSDTSVSLFPAQVWDRDPMDRDVGPGPHGQGWHDRQNNRPPLSVRLRREWGEGCKWAHPGTTRSPLPTYMYMYSVMYAVYCLLSPHWTFRGRSTSQSVYDIHILYNVLQTTPCIIWTPPPPPVFSMGWPQGPVSDSLLVSHFIILYNTHTSSLMIRQSVNHVFSYSQAGYRSPLLVSLSLLPLLVVTSDVRWLNNVHVHMAGLQFVCVGEVYLSVVNVDCTADLARATRWLPDALLPHDQRPVAPVSAPGLWIAPGVNCFIHLYILAATYPKSSYTFY